MDWQILWGQVRSMTGWVADNSLILAQVLAALVTAFATIALWRVTRVLAVETATLAKMTAQPFVVCWLESSAADPLALNLTLRNTGNATAFDIKIEVTPGLPKESSIKGPSPEEGSKTEFETSLLPPEQMLSVLGTMGPQVHNTQFAAVISWSTYPGAADRQTLMYKFQAKDGFRGGFHSKGVHQIAQELEKIRKQLPRK